MDTKPSVQVGTKIPTTLNDVRFRLNKEDAKTYKVGQLVKLDAQLLSSYAKLSKQNDPIFQALLMRRRDMDVYLEDDLYARVAGIGENGSVYVSFISCMSQTPETNTTPALQSDRKCLNHVDLWQRGPNDKDPLVIAVSPHMVTPVQEPNMNWDDTPGSYVIWGATRAKGVVVRRKGDNQITVRAKKGLEDQYLTQKFGLGNVSRDEDKWREVVAKAEDHEIDATFAVTESP